MNSMIGKKIGEGGYSEVFEWGGPHQIVKIGKANTSFKEMRKEFASTLIVWEHGLPAVRPLEFIEVDGSPAIVFERIHGVSLLERFLHQMLQSQGMAANGDFNKDSIHTTARLLNDVHRISNLHLQPQREILIHSILKPPYLSSSEKDEVIKRLQHLPMKSKLCHGDPNPGNILISDEKAVFIDWLTASIGNPEADVAEYILMIRYAILPEQLPSFAVKAFDSIREKIVSIFCEEYCKLSGITYEEIDEWIVPVAARKLCADAISEEEKRILLNEIRSKL
ncbi:aminoglycoside phosphotransferase family protein [Salipaludibacillus sp. HK11]|uniref:aminoglycoside phosphotransferase family protein n=1 Tax=Salipaludibacillus sp. HK11 TaxID=3394320 RepID=UPI0039FDA5A1